MTVQDDFARDHFRPYAEQWVAESPYLGDAAEEEAQIHPWYQGYTPFVEGRELEETLGLEAEWESDLAALEAESPSHTPGLDALGEAANIPAGRLAVTSLPFLLAGHPSSE